MKRSGKARLSPSAEGGVSQARWRKRWARWMPRRKGGDWGAWSPAGARHGTALARQLDGIDGDEVGPSGLNLGKRLVEETAGEPGVVEAGGAEKAVGGAPIELTQTEGDQQLGQDVAAEGTETAEHEGRQPLEGPLLAKGDPMGDQRFEEHGEQDRGGLGMLDHGDG